MGRSRADAAHFTSLFKNKHVTKQYWAVLAGVPNPRSGRLAVPLKELGQGMGVAANMQGGRLSCDCCLACTVLTARLSYNDG